MFLGISIHIYKHILAMGMAHPFFNDGTLEIETEMHFLCIPAYMHNARRDLL